MYCRKCGKELNDEALFCKNCGTPTTTDKSVAKYNSINKTGSNVKKSKGGKKPPVILFVGIAAAAVVLAVVLAGAGIGVAVINSDGYKEKKELKTAQKYEAAKDYDNAMASYEILMQMDVLNSEYYKAYARIFELKADDYLLNGNIAEAGEQYNQEFVFLAEAYERTNDEFFIMKNSELADMIKTKGFRTEGTQIVKADMFSAPTVDSSREYSADENTDIALMKSVREAVITAYLDNGVVSTGGGIREGNRIAIDKLFVGNAETVFLDTLKVKSFDELREKLKSEEAKDAGQIYVDSDGYTLSVYCATLRVGEQPKSKALSGGTFGDWAVIEAPVNYYQGGSIVLASQAAVDSGKADGIKELIEYVTLDVTENGNQHAWADGSYFSEKNAEPKEIVPANGGKKGNIELYAVSYELPNIINEYCKAHPDFGYTIKVHKNNSSDEYQKKLDKALKNGEADIYECDTAYAVKYSQGHMAKFAAAYEDLGIDAVEESRAAESTRYMVHLGTRTSDKKIVGLGYQNTVGMFVYRRSIAKAVWGTDDPYVISKKIGSGTGSWNDFMAAAKELKDSGYAICSGTGDVSAPVLGSAKTSWVVDKKLVIDPKREKLMDLTKKLYDKGYTNDTDILGGDWYADMKDGGSRQVFGFFGTADFINDVLVQKCGNAPSDYVIEGGAVASEKIMNENVCTPDILDNQDIFDVVVTAGANTKGKNASAYDDVINTLWMYRVNEYKYDRKTKEQAIKDFKKDVKDQLGIDAE